MQTLISNKEFIDWVNPSCEHMNEFQVHTLARLLISFIPMADFFHRNNIIPKKISSFGAGSCSHEAFLSDIYPNSQIDCYDLSRQYIPAYTLKKIDNSSLLSFTEIAVETLNWDTYKAKSDLVFSIQTLEHIEDCENALENISSTVTPGGYIYIDTPFYSELDFQETDEYLSMERKRQWEKNQHFHLGFSRKKMSERLEALGFTIVDEGYSSYRRGDTKLLQTIRADESLKGKKSDHSLSLETISAFHSCLNFFEDNNKDNYLRIDEGIHKDRICYAIRVLAKKNVE